MSLLRYPLGLVLGIVTISALAAGDISVEDLARRLKALELRLGRGWHRVRFVPMSFTDLSVQDQELVRAFFEIARDECGVLSWAEVEPVLAACWDRTHRRSSELQWHG